MDYFTLSEKSTRLENSKNNQNSPNILHVISLLVFQLLHQLNLKRIVQFTISRTISFSLTLQPRCPRFLCLVSLNGRRCSVSIFFKFMKQFLSVRIVTTLRQLILYVFSYCMPPFIGLSPFSLHLLSYKTHIDSLGDHS